jgi:hypothetical protein
MSFARARMIPEEQSVIKIDKEIPPGQSVPFNYKSSPPLPVRKDGYFEITAKVVGFTRVYR